VAKLLFLKQAIKQGAYKKLSKKAHPLLNPTLKGNRELSLFIWYL